MVLRLAALAAILAFAASGTALAYVGPSFMEIPGVAGTSRSATYKNWIEIAAQDWPTRPSALQVFVRRRDPKVFSSPFAPRSGAGSMNVAIDKRSPVLPQLMEQCATKASIPSVTYAESADLARASSEIGARPAEVPEFFEYKLTDVTISACAVIPEAPEQSFVMAFKNIQWLNYQNEAETVPTEVLPAKLPPRPKSGTTKAFVVTWLAPAHDISADQCPAMPARPTEADYFAYVPKAAADQERAELARTKNGVNYENGQMEKRGPGRLNVCRLPGIVPDPGHPAPKTKIARGLNLDGDDGTGEAPADTCKHPNYASADGRTGIDNQYFTAAGCIAGYMGHKGFYYQYVNEERRNGHLTMLVDISGIDDARNDDEIAVTFLFSKDKMAKDATGAHILPDYTFRLTDKPELTYSHISMRGRIENGAIVTDPVDQMRLTRVFEGDANLRKAVVRLEIMPDGSLKGLVGGYQDWRRLASSGQSQFEYLQGFQCPGFYHALRGAADGLKDPNTGACSGISSAWDIEGVPAFLPPSQRNGLIAQADAN